MDMLGNKFSDGKETEELEFVLMDVVGIVKVLMLFKVTQDVIKWMKVKPPSLLHCLMLYRHPIEYPKPYIINGLS